jgi:hydroxysqualene synthase
VNLPLRPDVGPDLAAAYAACETLARQHYENFPVASHLLPRAMRPHVAAVYAFARVADDYADEGSLPPSERLQRLDQWGARLRACTSDTTHDDEGGSAALIFRALGHTIRECGLPVPLLEDLLSAFRQDTTTPRYGRWEDVLDYCRRSANPVGRLVLRIAGYRDPRLDVASDAVCTALQLTNFWQDLEVDWRRGRLYVPADVASQHGACEADLNAGSLSPAWRATIEDLADRTEQQFRLGRAVCDGVAGRLKVELRFTWLGGMRVLERLRGVGFDVFRSRPTLTPRDLPVLAWRAWRWRRTAQDLSPEP